MSAVSQWIWPAAAAFARTCDLLLIFDAAQRTSVITVGVQAKSINALCFTGHKSLYNIGGSGNLILSERMLVENLEPPISGGSCVQSLS